MVTEEYDYIIVGGGLAGTSLLCRMIDDSFFASKKILLLTKPLAAGDEKTWCFWENSTSYFDSIVHHTWNQLTFKSTDFTSTESIAPYAYKMIRSVDFFSFAAQRISKAANVEIKYATVQRINEVTGQVVTNEGVFTATKYIFSSMLSANWQQQLSANNYLLLQHFKGWFIETSQPVFDSQVATMMDFSVPQTHGTTFMYCLPTTSNTALVEYTLFTKNILDQTVYDEAIKNYLRHAGIQDYTVTQTEFGIIPMSNYLFPKQAGKLIQIGTAGGATKASTGYTFYFVQHECEQIIKQLVSGQELELLRTFSDKKYRLFDSTLLGILNNENHLGAEIFTQLFQRNSVKAILKFLNNQSTFLDDLRIMNSVNKKLFIPAALKHLHTFK